MESGFELDLCQDLLGVYRKQEADRFSQAHLPFSEKLI
jgi:hypothetical protein